ncbi:hypothetical protein SAMN05192574_102188 [Mucilaginibacter gossypiicola]|uniref:Toprim-like n=1 Tax=Mucilaginibacter gossypiicola TaxID=551995 RepID=A0A1H8D3A4_9SPHI|nr:hypothetical protein [Mucilaginibacter gossypiicola]SEN01665.1 hypothetical protein SAMN05192574_102188 [Mucilaginibacter gossypiicola]
MSVLLTAKELKDQASLVDFLARLGYHPVKKSRREKLYLSMLRENDTKPSFSVNDELGVWFDHGTRKGGNIVDLGLAMWSHLSFGEVIKKIQMVCDVSIAEKKPLRPRISVKVPNYIVIETKPIGTHPAITNYLKRRQIFEQARDILQEIYYFVQDQKGDRKSFYAAGWKNEKNAWEVRNKYFKGCLGNKAISFIQGHSKKAAVFEGFINYLSWKVENATADHSIIVLNSIALLADGIEKAKSFSFLDVYFDRDQSGLTATNEFIAALPYASDRSGTFDGFNDYNDKLVAAAKMHEQQVSMETVPKTGVLRRR